MELLSEQLLGEVTQAKIEFELSLFGICVPNQTSDKLSLLTLNSCSSKFPNKRRVLIS